MCCRINKVYLLYPVAVCLCLREEISIWLYVNIWVSVSGVKHLMSLAVKTLHIIYSSSARQLQISKLSLDDKKLIKEVYENQMNDIYFSAAVLLHCIIEYIINVVFGNFFKIIIIWFSYTKINVNWYSNKTNNSK